MKGLKARYNCNRFEIEKDIVIEAIDNQLLDSKVVLEVNGLWHYTRNSTELLGKDKLKTKALASLGYQTIYIPYYDWCLLEQK